MLEMHAACLWCTKPLDPSGENAMICSYECTFCCNCAVSPLQGICPNCKGPLRSRPPRFPHDPGRGSG